jgi:hypothetical protein
MWVWSGRERPDLTHIQSSKIGCWWAASSPRPVPGRDTHDTELTFGATCTIFRAGTRPNGSRGPQEAENGPKPGAGFIIYLPQGLPSNNLKCEFGLGFIVARARRPPPACINPGTWPSHQQRNVTSKGIDPPSVRICMALAIRIEGLRP